MLMLKSLKGFGNIVKTEQKEWKRAPESGKV